MYEKTDQELWPPETTLDLFMFELSEYEEAVQDILETHGNLKCNGLVNVRNCHTCESIYKDLMFGMNVYVLGDSLRREPLYQDMPFVETGFDPFEFTADGLNRHIQSYDNKIITYTNKSPMSPTYPIKISDTTNP